MSWFGRKKSAQAPSSVKSKQPMTIAQLRESISTQEKLEEPIQRKIDAMAEKAKIKEAKNDKKGALSALKRKNLLVAELDKIQNAKMALETQFMNLELEMPNVQTLQAIKTIGGFRGKTVPNAELPVLTREEEDELKKLEAELVAMMA